MCDPKTIVNHTRCFKYRTFKTLQSESDNTWIKNAALQDTFPVIYGSNTAHDVLYYMKNMNTSP